MREAAGLRGCEIDSVSTPGIVAGEGDTVGVAGVVLAMAVGVESGIDV